VSINPDDGDIVANGSFAFGIILGRSIPNKGVIAICCLLIVVLFLQVLAQIQAMSRFIFALARDNALPFGEIIRRTNNRKNPVIANWLAAGVCMPFALLLLGGQGTLYSVLAVTNTSLSYAGYMIPVVLYLLSGKNLQVEGRTTWSLRSWSKPLGWIGVLFALLVLAVQAFPGGKPVTVQNVSWSPVVLVGTCVVCFITWVCYGNEHYSGPIRALTKWETGVEIDLESTLGPKSKPSALTPAVEGNGGMDDTIDDSKLGITPYLSDIHATVTVESAKSGESMRGGEWTDVVEESQAEALNYSDTSGDSRGSGSTAAREMGISRGESHAGATGAVSGNRQLGSGFVQ